MNNEAEFLSFQRLVDRLQTDFSRARRPAPTSSQAKWIHRAQTLIEEARRLRQELDRQLLEMERAERLQHARSTSDTRIM